MNKQDRKALESAVEKFRDAMEILNSISDSEQEKYENLSEGLQATEKGIKFEEDAAELREIHDEVDGLIERVETVINGEG